MPKTTITVNAPPERVHEFEAVFGSATVPVKSPFAFHAHLSIGRCLVYELDLEALDPAVRQRLVEHLAKKFGASAGGVERELAAAGFPLVAEGCTMMTDSLDFL